MFLFWIGISNTFGRIVIGFLGGLQKINRLYLYSTALTICGIATIVEPFFTDFIGLLVYSCLFGFFSGKFLLSFRFKEKYDSLLKLSENNLLI